MSATETELTPGQILEWSTKDLVISELSVGLDSGLTQYEPQMEYGYNDELYTSASTLSGYSNTYLLGARIPITLARYQNDGNRKIGYISSVNSDGSFNMFILGDHNFKIVPDYECNTILNFLVTGEGTFNPLFNHYYFGDSVADFGAYSFVEITGHSGRYCKGTNNGANISAASSFDFIPEWKINDNPFIRAPRCIVHTGRKNAEYLFNSPSREYMLTDDISTSLNIGFPLMGWYYNKNSGLFTAGDKDIGGDLNGLGDNITFNIAAACRSLSFEDVMIEQQINAPNGNTYTLKENAFNLPINGSFAYHYIPYNLILTYNLDEAQNYIRTGALPSDAFIYPFDVDNIPVNKKGLPDDENSDGSLPDDTPNTGGDSGGEDTDNAPPRKPTVTPQALTNNNLYWLTSTQIKNFIDWFWTDATDVTNPQELFEKIQGLYSDLSQAIVNIRYMPVDPSWIGGVSLDSKIIVGLVEKEEQVQTINKTVSDIRVIGEIEIKQLEDFKGFINYSPYCQMSLYLPFYGFIDLDCDLLMPNDKRKNTNKLKVYATYDVLSGTIQYFIYRVSSTGNENMINCVSAKMAVDIPISLQTKTERDSMIFNNVSSATANLIGAGASVATGNPIGIVMSTAAIAGQQSSGAPMRVMGTIGESGAFYDDGHCALYIKRPATNYPEQYGKRIGFPYNAAEVLEELRGFVQCQNPYISFSHVTTEDSDGFPPPKPTAEEIETIYNALTEGVYLP